MSGAALAVGGTRRVRLLGTDGAVCMICAPVGLRSFLNWPGRTVSGNRTR